ncbi:MAG TPA: linear amide C-N hydrolase [Thermoanaerobaculia bacterium]|nr:linear amide C-N hydrolase [Thermoanaerobaculia bacterium]
MILLCTTFCLRALLAANYDWDTGAGMVMVNKRAVMKTAITGRPAQWTSRFASITLNQYGREFPTGGMNEAGLAIALMALRDTQYPAADERSSVTILEWIQYQLDNSATIDDVIERSSNVRIAGTFGLHYLVADRTGRAATIEFIDGNLVAHKDGTLPVPVLANDTYDHSLAYYKGLHSVPSGIGSMERFARAAAMIGQTPASANAVSRAFEILDAVHQPDYTKWSVVYDPATLTIHIRTDRNREIRTISFGSFDGACESPVRIAPIDGGTFVDYTQAANIALVNTAYDETPMLAGASEADRRETYLHPDSDICFQPQRSRAIRK